MARLHFAVLGPLDVRQDEQPLTIRGVMQRRLLGLLLSRANHVVSAERLIDDLWNAAPPPTAGKTLHSHVARLRDVLGPDRGVVETRPPGYLLRAGPETLDLLRFEQLVARGRRASVAGVPDASAAMLTEALTAWRGTAYADLLDCDALARESSRLADLRLATSEARTEAHLGSGRGTDLVADLQDAAAAHPTRETLWRHLAIALYRAGRPADALAAIERVRRHLRDDLGVDPSREIRDVEFAILRHDPVLHRGVEIHPSPLPSALTADTWPLIGRELELAWLQRAWADAARSRGRLVLVRGPGGIGRSRLLAELARDLASRGVAVHAGSCRTPGDVLAQALRPGTAPLPAAPADDVIADLQHAAELVPMLVVLDDLHLDPDGLGALLAAVPVVGSLPVLIAGSFDDTVETPALRTLLALVNATSDVWELGALTDAAVAQVVGSTVLPTDRPRAMAVAATTGGHPRHLRLAVTRAVERSAEHRLHDAVKDAADVRRDLGPVRASVTSGVLDLRSARRDRAADGHLEPPESATCPYKGLARYDVADAEYFVGRERLTAQLVGRLAEDDILAVVGASGSGKSSAARAGLLAALAEGALPGSDCWAQLIIVPGSDPPDALSCALARIDDHSPLVLLVDQFEEVFTACADEERRRTFVSALLELHGRGVRLVLTLRADFYGHCAAFSDLADRLSDSTILVGPLSELELVRAVEIPAHRAGLTVSPELTALVIADVGDEPGALPLLSTALLRTWENRHGRVLSVHSYREGGGIGSAVERLGESAYERMDPAAAAATRRLLVRLADPGPTDNTSVRRRAPRSEVVPENDDAAQRALDVLVDRRLVRVSEHLVEVTHEALFTAWPRLRSWLEDDVAGRGLVRHLATAAADWLATGREASELYRGTRLQAGLDWLALHAEDLTELEREYLEASAAEADRERQEAATRLAVERRSRRRLQRASGALAVVLAAALVAAGLAAISRRDAQVAAQSASRAALIADAERLGSLSVVTKDFDRSLLLAAQAVRLHDSSETRGDLLATLLRSPAAVAVVRPGGGHRLLTLDVAPDGRSLLVGDNAGNVLLVDTRTRKVDVIVRATSDGETIQATDFSADGKIAAIMHTSRDQIWVELYDLASRTLRRLPGAGSPWGLGWGPVGRRLAITQHEQDTIVVDVDRPERRPVGLWNSAGQMIGPVIWVGPDTVAIGPEKKRLGLWNTSTGRQTGMADVNGGLGVIAASPDRRLLAMAAGADIRLYDVPTLRHRATLTGHHAAILDLAFSPDGRHLASAADDREAIVWDVAKFTLVERLPGHAGRVIRAAWSPDSATVWTVSLDGSLMAWDIAGGQRLAQQAVRGGLTLESEHVALDAAGRHGVVVFFDGTQLAWDLTSGRQLGPRVRASTQALLSVAVSPDGTRYVSGGADGRARLYRLVTGELLGDVDGLPGSPVTSASFSPDGHTIAIGAQDGSLTLVDAKTRRPIGSPIKAGMAVRTTLWSADGGTVILAADDSADISVWSVATRQQLRRFAPSTQRTLAVALSPDGTRLAAGGNDGRIRFFDTTTWSQIGDPVLMAAGFIVSASFSEDGRLLVTGGTDGTVRLLDVETRKSLGPPLPGADNKWAFAQWASGNRVVAGFADGSAWVYDVDPASWARRACAVAGRQLTEAEWTDALPGRAYERTC